MFRKKLMSSTIVYVLLVGYYALYGYLFEKDLNFGLAISMGIFLIPILFFFGLPVSLLIDTISLKIQNHVKSVSVLLHFLFIGEPSALILKPVADASGANLYCPVIVSVFLYWLLNHYFMSTLKEQKSTNGKYAALKRKLLVGAILFWCMIVFLVTAYGSDEIGLGMFFWTLYIVPLIFFIGVPVSIFIEFLAKKVRNQYWGIISISIQIFVFAILSYMIMMFYKFGQWNLNAMDRTEFIHWLSWICLFQVIDFVIIFINTKYKMKESNDMNKTNQ